MTYGLLLLVPDSGVTVTVIVVGSPVGSERYFVAINVDGIALVFATTASAPPEVSDKR